MNPAVKGLKTVFQTDRLVFRHVEGDSDRGFIHDSLHSDPVNNVFSGPELLRPAGTKEAASIVSLLSSALLGIIICLRPDEAASRQGKQAGRPIGYLWITGGARPPSDGGPGPDDGGGPSYVDPNGTSDLGISIAEEFQGRGYGAEAINWAVDWAFRFARLHRVCLVAVEFNDRACALYRRLGFKEEGRQRELQYYDRRWWDVISFSMLEHEWEELRGLKKQ